ncbi:sugar phosphate isomerase/epimerase [Neolewinella xylanilytica]|uniref:Sugar phosphate isomerase/epimerase n=1 Tax=Neolewinella xylanilytica TaxID=1514080 RepID=A0A2S6I1N1_9BACT|nr:sugar phosphate isomerase/epimerase [Neolewinella xylanilytica]PPK85082.1 sugar phosphate isomerase/epimerase [Neolewinella xylanilytica]
MPLAIHNWMRAEPLEATLARIKPLGYDYLEIQGTPADYDTREVRALLKKYDIRCWGSVTLMLGKRNLLAADAGERAASVQYVKDVITLVKELDGTMVSVVPGTVGKIMPGARPEEEWDWAVASMQACYEFAQAAGIQLGIEPINRFETYFVNRGEQAYALAEATGPDCGVCLDIFHMNLEEPDYYTTIAHCGDRLVGFHVADNNRMAPGMGHLDWPRIVEAVKNTGFTGPLSVEFAAPVDRTPANPYPNSVDADPQGLTEEARKFLEDHGSSALTEEFYTMLTRKSAETLLPLL